MTRWMRGGGRGSRSARFLKWMPPICRRTASRAWHSSRSGTGISITRIRNSRICHDRVPGVEVNWKSTDLLGISFIQSQFNISHLTLTGSLSSCISGLLCVTGINFSVYCNSLWESSFPIFWKCCRFWDKFVAVVVPLRRTPPHRDFK